MKSTKAPPSSELVARARAFFEGYEALSRAHQARVSINMLGDLCVYIGDREVLRESLDHDGVMEPSPGDDS